MRLVYKVMRLEADLATLWILPFGGSDCEHMMYPQYDQFRRFKHIATGMLANI